MKTCPCCKSDYEKPEAHTPMEIHYLCPKCEHWFRDEWCSAVDGTCPVCETKNISPMAISEWPNEEEEEEEEEDFDIEPGAMGIGNKEPGDMLKFYEEMCPISFKEWQKETMKYIQNMESDAVSQMTVLYGSRGNSKSMTHLNMYQGIYDTFHWNNPTGQRPIAIERGDGPKSARRTTQPIPSLVTKTSSIPSEATKAKLRKKRKKR